MFSSTLKLALKSRLHYGSSTITQRPSRLLSEFFFRIILIHLAMFRYVPFLGMAGSNMVATGGGTNDYTVRVWNLSTGSTHTTLDTFSQVKLGVLII